MTVAVHNNKTYRLVGIIKEKVFNRYILIRPDMLAIVKDCKIVSKIDDSVRIYDFRYVDRLDRKVRICKYMGRVRS